jgi:hypothetical protein
MAQNKANKRFSHLEGMTYAQKLEYFSRSSNEISINNGNSKTGQACLTISLPTITCRADAPCRKGCYCMRGRQTIPNVCGAYYRNFRIWQENPVEYEEQLYYHIKFSGLTLCRYNDAGDIPDREYFDMMVRVAIRLPEVKFLCYTKKYDIINKYLDEGKTIPENLCVRFSYWDKQWEVDNPHNLPVAYVDFKKKERNVQIPKNAFECPAGKATCSVCKMCFHQKVKAVYFHEH